MSYALALVSYIDLLGFSDQIDASCKDTEKIEKIVGILALVKEELSAGGRTHRNADGRKQRIFYSYNFSDLTVRCTLMPDGADPGEFVNWELLYVADKQLALSCQGILIRGGMCIGEVRVDSQVVFGPAIVKAYKLEREYAIYPRVVIDRNIIWDTAQPTSSPMWNDHVRQGEDGAYFLDYLFGSILNRYSFPYPEQPDAGASLQQHRDMITGVLETIEGRSERIKQKYMWLGLYHNEVIRRLKQRTVTADTGINFDQYLIMPSLLRF